MFITQKELQEKPKAATLRSAKKAKFARANSPADQATEIAKAVFRVK